MKRPVVLVTGSNGFIGGHVAEALRGDYRLVGIDHGSVNFPGRTDAYYQAHLPSSDVLAIVEKEKPRVCVHCAGSASVGYSVDHPAFDFQAGPVAVFTLLDALRQHAPECLFIFPSSAAVYGNPERLPVREDAPLRPISPYGYHKRMSEEVVREFHELYGMRHAILRIFSCYGVGLRKQLIWDVARKIAAGRLTLFGSGQETRDFIHALDVAAFIRLLVEKDLSGLTLNLAAGVGVQVSEIVEIVREAFGPECPPAEFDGCEKPGDPLHWEADVSAMRALGFTPSVSLKEGLAAYVRWFKEKSDGGN